MAKFGKNIILHNRYLLYFIFIVALSDFLYLVYINDIYSASIFALIGFLTSFFSKNMIVILVMAMAVSNIIKFGNRSAVKEGFTDDDVAEDEVAEDEVAEDEEAEHEEASKENKDEPENKKRGLIQLESLLKEILKRWPDVEFKTSVELGEIIRVEQPI